MKPYLLISRGMFARLEQNNDNEWDTIAVFPASQAHLVMLRRNQILLCGCGAHRLGECGFCEFERLAPAA